MYVDIPDNDRLFWSCDEAESQLLISSQINDARLWNVFGIDREPLSRIFIGCRFIQMAAIKTGKSFRKSRQYSCHAILFKWQQRNTKRANKKSKVRHNRFVSIKNKFDVMIWATVDLGCFGQYTRIETRIFLSSQNPKKPEGRHHETSVCKPWHR